MLSEVPIVDCTRSGEVGLSTLRSRICRTDLFLHPQRPALQLRGPAEAAAVQASPIYPAAAEALRASSAASGLCRGVEAMIELLLGQKRFLRTTPHRGCRGHPQHRRFAFYRIATVAEPQIVVVGFVHAVTEMAPSWRPMSSPSESICARAGLLTLQTYPVTSGMLLEALALNWSESPMARSTPVGATATDETP
jgi:hypothetical protein